MCFVFFTSFKRQKSIFLVGQKSIFLVDSLCCQFLEWKLQVDLQCVYWSRGHPDNENQSDGGTNTIDSNIFELFFCKKRPLSRRVGYVMGGSVSGSVSGSVRDVCMSHQSDWICY